MLDPAPWNVRAARSREERERIFRFRFDNHVSEYGRWPSGPQATGKSIREIVDEVAVHMFAESDGKVIGAARLRIGPIPAELRDSFLTGRLDELRSNELAIADQIAVAGAFRRSGLVDALLRAVIEYCEIQSVRFLFSHAQENLARELKRHGFREHGQVFDLQELGPRVPLLRVIGGEAW